MAKALIVDDDKLICWSLQEIISQLGYSVEIAAETASARQIMTKEQYALIFIDMELKEESGIQLLKEVKSLQPDSRIVILSALNKEQIEAEISGYDIFALLEKPFESNRIREIAIAVLGQDDKG
jgi:DNA-binding NtrC family response regulator